MYSPKVNPMRFGTNLARLIGLALAFVLLSSPVTAASTPWVQAQEAQLRLISESSTVGTDETIRIGMEFKLTPHWKIYWRSPGDAGLPPIPDYEGSKNLKSAEFQWPLPDRFDYLGIETFGYEDNVVFPIDVVLNEAGKATEVKVAVDYLICEELCIPGNANLSMKLDGGALTQDVEASLISAAMATVPTATSDAIAVEDFSLDMSQENPVLVVSTSSTAGFTKPEMIIEGPEGYFFNPVKMSASQDMKFATFTTTAEKMYEPDTPMTEASLRITLVDGVDAVDVKASDLTDSGIPQSQNLTTKAGSLSFTLLISMLLAALLGGLILNLMPCVLPVLSIKLMSVIDKSGKSNRDVRLGFLATTAGIITSFLVLAIALIALKAAGASIGWGVQFQQPIFVLVLMAIILLFAANMFGWFEITLPSKLANLGSGENKGLASDFATGAFATLLATPCSAPFLGTAVSFALAQSAFTIVLIFAALGVGMALPYILVIIFPRLVAYLPKPGMWMVKLRMVLGGLLILTAAWLMTVLAAQLGWLAVLVAVAISLVLLAVLWVMRSKRSVLPLAALAISAALVIFPPLFKADMNLNAKELEKPWVHFNQAAIAQHISEGKVVYVDVTADWCVTCKVNKAVVFASDDVKKVFASKDTVAMLSDWTRPSAEINTYLQSFNRAGIPFNVIYSAKYPQGKPLPEILTPGLVLEELAMAR